MEMKTGILTSKEASQAANEHYEAENEIMSHLKHMTLAGKRHLAKAMPSHVAESEKQSKA